MGVHEHWLGVGVADDADACVAFELLQFAFEPSSEVRTFKIVD
jgi:hypothetical protein